MFKNLFSFSGRIRRTEFGISFIIYFVIYIGLMIMKESYPGDTAISGIFLLCLVPLAWFLWSQGAKRCHDLNNSGWYQLIPFYVFVLLFQAGNKYPNEYGPNPKDPEQKEFDPAYYEEPNPSQLDSSHPQ